MIRNDDKYIVALELSGTAVRLAAARLGEGNQAPEIVAVETADKVACMQYGRVQNLIEAANHVSYVIQKLENNPALKRGKVSAVYLALAGRTLSTVKTSAEIALPTEMEISEELVRRLYNEAVRDISPDRSVLKVLPRKYIVDNHPVANPVGAMGARLKGEFTVVVCSPVNRRNLELVMDERLNMPVADYVVTPLAEARLALSEEEKQLGCVLVDFGAHTTTISIYKDRSLQYIATLPLGSHNITRDLAVGLSLTDERAEFTKCSVGSALSKSASAEANRVNGFVQARLGEIVANIMAQIGFAGYKPNDLPGGLIFMGGGTRLKNFTKYVESQTKMKIRQASVGTSVTVAPPVAATPELLPLISIVAMAAARRNPVGCVEMPAPVVSGTDDEEAAPARKHDDQRGTSGYPVPEDEYIDDEDDEEYAVDDEDEDWDVDDDVAERRAAERKQRAKERREQLVRNDERRRRQRDEQRRRDARKINHDADLDTEADDAPAQHKESILERIKQGVANIFRPSVADDDADLDDEQ